MTLFPTTCLRPCEARMTPSSLRSSTLPCGPRLTVSKNPSTTPRSSEAPNNSAPFLGFLYNELAEIRGGTGQGCPPQISKSLLELGVGERRMRRSIQRCNNFHRCVSRRTEAEQLAGLVTRNEIGYCRDMR